MNPRLSARCPACAVPLVATRDGLARCPRCDGVLAAHPAFSRWTGSARDASVVCPACSALMRDARALSASFAVCPRCGVAWLSARAIDALATGAEDDVARFAENARREARREADA